MLREKRTLPNGRPSLAVQSAIAEMAIECRKCIENAGLDPNEKSHRLGDVRTAAKRFEVLSKKKRATNYDAAVAVHDLQIALSDALHRAVAAAASMPDHPVNGHAADVVARAALRIVELFDTRIVPRLFGRPKSWDVIRLRREIKQTPVPREKIKILRAVCDVRRALGSVYGAPVERGTEACLTDDESRNEGEIPVARKNIPTVGKNVRLFGVFRGFG